MDRVLVPLKAGVWDAEQEVALKQSWGRIDRTAMPRQESEHVPRKHGGWITVRVFISSTFTDTFAEREILLKRVGRGRLGFRV